MFIEQILRKNTELARAAFALHQGGRILPDSYLVDMDSLLENAKKILEAGKREQIKLFFMLKQLGRNPYIGKKLMELGYEGAVAVDFREAQVLMKAGIPIGNVGHLVQIPDALLPEMIARKPQVITVYSLEKLKKIDMAARDLGMVQGILLRVYDKGDLHYSGQTAGFSLEELPKILESVLKTCRNVIIRGATSFPCYLYDEKQRDIMPTNNLNTVIKAAEILKAAGVKADIINTPSATCVRTIEKMKERGGNCGEPGHGLTGTTPLHACCEAEELPAVVYVSEISHNFMGNAYCYGGGHYRRSHVSDVLVGRNLEEAKRLRVIPPSHESIDYHFGISEECEVGDTAVMAFRYQMFVTRSDVVLLEGAASGHPEIIGIYDSMGNRKDI